MNVIKKFGFTISIILILTVSLFSMKCSVKDLEDQMPSNFIENNFLGIGGLPEIEDEPLNIVQPNMPTVTAPQIITRMVENLHVASKPYELSSETEAIISLLTDLDGFSSSYFRQNLLNKVQNLDENDLTLVYFGKSELDNIFSEMVKSAMINPNSMKLFPSINHPETLSVSRVLEVSQPTSVPLKVNSSKNGRCADAAKDALDRAIKRLESKRDEQINMVEVNLQFRLKEANQRFELQNKNAEQKYLDNLKASGQEVSKMLKAAERLGRNNPALGEELRLLALIYAYSWQMIFKEEYNASLALNELARQNEINEAINRKKELEFEIVQNYNKELVNAIATLERVLAACHNQGEGN